MLAAICAQIRECIASPDPDDDPDDDPRLDRAVSLDTTIDGAGVLRGDLMPECGAITVTAVLDALSAPEGGGDLRTRPQRYHYALAEAIRRWPAAIGSTSAELNPALLSPDPPRSVTPRIQPERADVIRQNQEPQTVAKASSSYAVVPDLTLRSPKRP
jgi:hypothetical protein